MSNNLSDSAAPSRQRLSMGLPGQIATKPCHACGEQTDPSEFSYYTHRTLKDGSKSRAIRHQWCSSCQQKQRRNVAELKKLHPRPPIGTPCDCCGAPMSSPQLDHTHDGANTFRGWLCSNCNRGIGALGDDAKGVLHALNYLLK
jgi:hypothetical protein